MKTILLSAAAFLFAITTQSQNTSFEASEGYNLGLISGQNGWTVSSLFTNMFTVSSNQASNGVYSLRLGLDETGWLPSGSVVCPVRTITSQVPVLPDTYEVSADLYFTSTEVPKSEIDFYVYGALGTDALPGGLMALGNGFVRVIEMDTFTAAAIIDVPNDVFTNLRMKFDFVNQQTLHYVNNVLVYTGVLNLSKVTGYGFLTTGKTVGYADNVMASTNLLSTPNVEQNRFSHFVSNNQLNITSPSTMSDIEIFNVTGQKVISQPINSTDSAIEISGLSSGIYLAKLKFQNATKTFKFVK